MTPAPKPRPSSPRRNVPWVVKAIVAVFVAGTVFVGGTAVVGAVAVVHEGFLKVDVREKQAGGDRVRFFVPAIIVTGPMRLAPLVMPADAWGDAREELSRVRPLVQGIAREMDRCPDGTLVEVRDHDAHVTIRVQGGALLVDVDDREAEVHLTVPLSLLDAAADILPRS